MSSQREKTRRIAWIVSEQIREVTTPGLGRWGPTWEFVAAPSDRFMDSLYLWETSGARDDLEAMQRHAEALVTAWREADTQFQISRLEDGESPMPVVTEEVEVVLNPRTKRLRVRPGAG